MLANAVNTENFSNTNAPASLTGADSVEHVGARITRAREACGLSIEDLALRLGVRTDTLSAWETGQAEPRPNRLTMLAGMLNVTPGWLLFDCGDEPIEASASADLYDMRRELAALKTVLQSSLTDAERMLSNIDKMIETKGE